MMRGWACVTAMLVIGGPQLLLAQSATPETVGPGVVSTDGNETFPSVDPVTGALWYSVYDRSFDDQTIMTANRMADGWAAPRVAPFSGRWGDRAPRFSADGSMLYFTSNRPAGGGDDPADMNIWRVERKGDGWGEPEVLPPPFNSSAADMHVAPTADALWLASSRQGGRGRSDIYRVGWGGEVTHLGPAINDELSQPDLWVSQDGRVMILAITDGPGGLGGDDLYISRLDGATWSAPVNLGPAINSADYEYGPTVSPDGRFLYYTSHRDGSADVYRVALSAVLRRED